MAPNVFICFRTILCPYYWFQKGERLEGSIIKEEHWDSPVPGTYRYIPSRGWHLIRRDGAEEDEKEPRSVVYCRIIHRYVLSSDMEQRCRWYTVVKEEGREPERCLFFRLDDDYTWVIGWDSRGKFIPGPYRKWCYDKEAMTMRRMVSYGDSSASTSRSSSLVP
jgi:hypothetical protein